FGGGDDGNSHPVHHAGDIFMAYIRTAAGPADSLGSDKSAITAFTVLDMNPENSLLVVSDKFIVLYVSLFLKNAAQIGFHAGGGDVQLVKPCFLRIANAVKEVAYRIRYHHDLCSPPVLPACLDHAGKFSPEGHIAEADPADSELAVVGSRPTA